MAPNERNACILDTRHAFYRNKIAHITHAICSIIFSVQRASLNPRRDRPLPRMPTHLRLGVPPTQTIPPLCDCSSKPQEAHSPSLRLGSPRLPGGIVLAAAPSALQNEMLQTLHGCHRQNKPYARTALLVFAIPNL